VEFWREKGRGKERKEKGDGERKGKGKGSKRKMRGGKEKEPKGRGGKGRNFVQL